MFPADPTQMISSSAVTKTKSQGHVVAKNTALSFVQQLAPMLVAFVTIPYVIHKLGIDRFGILSLAWILLGYVNIFDLGMGRATTRFIAEAVGKGEHHRISRITYTTLLVQVVSGVAAGIILVLVTPVLTDKILRIPPTLITETRFTFFLLSVSIPLTAVIRNFRAVLEANQRFDIITTIQTPFSCVNYLLPAFGAWAGLLLPGIVLLVTISRAVTAFVYFLMCLKVVPDLRHGINIEKQLLRPLFKYGGWVTICDFVAPFLGYGYLDRFVIGSVSSMQAVGYYAAPFEAISKVLIIPSAIMLALFPALGTASAVSGEQVANLYVRAVKLTLVVMTPIVLVATLFASNILTLWIGQNFSQRSTLVFQLLSVGMLPYAVQFLPGTLLDAVGRPDLRAKVMLSLLLPYSLMLLYLTKKFGVNGTAASWLSRACIEFLLFLWVSRKVLRTTSPEPGEGLTRSALISGVVLLGAGVTLFVFGNSLAIKGFVTGVFLLLFAAAAWRFVVDDPVKNYMFAFVRGKWAR